MMKWIRTKLPLLIVVAVSAVLLAYGFRPVPVEVDVVVAQRGSFEVTVNDDGETRIREKYIVSSPVIGKLLRVELHAGDMIQQGETVLARIEPTDPTLLDVRSQAEAEARLHAAEAACRQAEAQREQADEALGLAAHQFERAQKLLARQTLSRDEYDRFEHEHQMARANLKSADFAVRVADFERELARAAFVRTRDADEAAGGEHPAPLTIVAPVSGRVLRVFQEDAGVVSPGTQLMELGDPGDLEMEIDVLSTDAVRIQRGARVYVDHWGGTGTLEGTVRVVEPAAFLKISALGVEEKRVNIIADFGEPCEHCFQLGDGYRIEARIVVAAAENIVKIPAGVLFRHGDAWHVYRIVDGVARRQKVTIGLSNGLEAEVIEGLSPGDRVIVHPTDKVTDGVSVRQASESA